MKNRIAILLFLFLLLQSCVAYHAPVSSLEAARDKGKVKVVYKDGLELNFNSIELNDSTYLGLTNVYSFVENTNREKTEWRTHYTPISQNEVSGIYV